MSFSDKVRVALVQDSPVIFDLKKTLKKSAELIRKAAESKPDLIVFPESFIPAYPRNMIFGSRIGSRSKEGRELWLRYYNNSVCIPGPEITEIENLSKEISSYISMGITEKHGKSLFCTQVLISPKNGLISRHRKIKPTAAERIVWAEGNGADLGTQRISETVLGTLICWENYMPLARMAMYTKGVNIYLAPTADNRDSWQTTLSHIAMEGRCFVIGVNQHVTVDDYPEFALENDPDKEQKKIISRGGSCIISPLGDYIAGPVWGKNEIIVADLDLDSVTESSLDFDAGGHYNRPDIFKLKIADQPETLVD